MKNIIRTVLIIFFLATTTVWASGINGKIFNERTYVPVRDVFEGLGFTVDYNKEQAVAVASDKNYSIKIPKYKSYFEVNGQAVVPDFPQKIYDESFFVSLRSVSLAIGANVSWDSESKIAIIRYENKEVVVYCNPTNIDNNDLTLDNVALMDEYSNIPDFADLTGFNVQVKYSGENVDAFFYTKESSSTSQVSTYFTLLQEKFGYKRAESIYDPFTNVSNVSLDIYTKGNSETLVFIYDDSDCALFIYADNEAINFDVEKLKLNSDEGVYGNGINVYIPDGKGSMSFTNIGQYEGYFKNGQRNGTGIFTWEDGDCYDGTWKNDEMSGYGIYTFADGKVLKGQWKNNKYIGK